MVSISLEPDIAVQKYENYIQIRGLIILQGEYKKPNLENLEEFTSNDDNLARYIENVMELDANYARFSHRFPVEVSIPSYRVDNLNDITVIVDSFDYELPDKNKLQLKASVHINGINADKVATDERTEEENGGLEAMKESGESTFHGMPDENEQLISEEIGETDSEAMKDHHTEIDFSEETEVETAIEDESKDDVVEKSEIEIQLSESEENEESDEVKDVRFLTDLFGGEEEETYTKMRIYITQEDDTIESIASRYEMSTLQLIKDNNLTGEGIHEGQLLYVPVKTEE